CRKLEFTSSPAFHGKRLKNHIIRTVESLVQDSCSTLCYMEPNCVSYNEVVVSSPPSITKCELNNSTHNEHPQDLKPWPNYSYGGTMNVCGKNLPCQNNATCQSGFTIKGYRCLCPPGFEGEHCEEDIDECQKNTHDCHLNATCQNTNGSFVCTCSFGFNGDGRNCTGISL
ncbi:unnamed protein product, partial [Pocillopora meandrina]